MAEQTQVPMKRTRTKHDDACGVDFVNDTGECIEGGEDFEIGGFCLTAQAPIANVDITCPGRPRPSAAEFQCGGPFVAWLICFEDGWAGPPVLMGEPVIDPDTGESLGLAIHTERTRTWGTTVPAIEPGQKVIGVSCYAKPGTGGDNGGGTDPAEFTCEGVTSDIGPADVTSLTANFTQVCITDADLTNGTFDGAAYLAGLSTSAAPIGGGEVQLLNKSSGTISFPLADGSTHEVGPNAMVCYRVKRGLVPFQTG